METNKIVIWGTVASGKTTLSKKLSYALNIDNILHTDEIILTPQLTTRGKSEAVNEINKRLKEGKWIIDGNLGELIPREDVACLADCIIIFHFPFRILLARLLQRQLNEVIYVGQNNNLTGLKERLTYIFNNQKLFFQSIKIMRNYNSFFVKYLKALTRQTHLRNKTFIISSRQKLEKFIELISLNH